MTPTPVVSVVICTYNRAERLHASISSVLAQDSGGVPFELLVVDNGSTDGTRGVAESFTATGRVRHILEPKLGLSNARNTGWQAARGRYVAYLDDDASACPGWLKAIPPAFDGAANVAIVGGRVTPIWEGTRPRWLSDPAARALTIVDWSPTPKLITDDRREWVAGANMAVRPEVLRDAGGFHPALGRLGSRMLSNEDIYLQRWVMARGYGCYYTPAMAVHHAIPPSRLSKRWFRRRYYSQGFSDALVRLLEDHPSGRARVHAAIRMAAWLLARPRDIAALILPTDDPERFMRKCRAWVIVGQAVGLLGTTPR